MMTASRAKRKIRFKKGADPLCNEPFCWRMEQTFGKSEKMKY